MAKEIYKVMPDAILTLTNVFHSLGPSPDSAVFFLKNSLKNSLMMVYFREWKRR
jgi:hypothetical protein